MKHEERRPAEQRDAEGIAGCVRRHADAAGRVPEAFLIQDVCLVIMDVAGWALNYLPYARRTPEVCLAAVRSSGDALEDVPEEMKTPEMCAEAIRGGVLDADLEWVPEGMRTKEMCLRAVRESGNALRLVPERLRTSPICAAVAVAGGCSLMEIPLSVLTPTMCYAAVSRDGASSGTCRRRCGRSASAWHPSGRTARRLRGCLRRSARLGSALRPCRSAETPCAMFPWGSGRRSCVLPRCRPEAGPFSTFPKH